MSPKTTLVYVIEVVDEEYEVKSGGSKSQKCGNSLLPLPLVPIVALFSAVTSYESKLNSNIRSATE